MTDTPCNACNGTGAMLQSGYYVQVRDLRWAQKQLMKQRGYSDQDIVPCAKCSGRGVQAR